MGQQMNLFFLPCSSSYVHSCVPDESLCNTWYHHLSFIMHSRLAEIREQPRTGFIPSSTSTRSLACSCQGRKTPIRTPTQTPWRPTLRRRNHKNSKKAELLTNKPDTHLETKTVKLNFDVWGCDSSFVWFKLSSPFLPETEVKELIPERIEVRTRWIERTRFPLSIRHFFL